MEAIGTLAAILTTASFLPQAIKTIKTGDTSGLSLIMYIAFTAGVFLWMIYGFLISDGPLFVANVITFIFAAIILSFIVKNTINSRK